jgi:hypothetical protein
MKGEIMIRILFVFLFTATLTITAFSQTQNQPENTPVCNLSLSQAPAIRGIRLGMKPDEWLKLFPGSDQDERLKAILDKPPAYPEYGRKSITFESKSASIGAFKISSEDFPGVERVYLYLFDGQIVQFSIEYSPISADRQIPLWDNVSQLIAIFSKTFNLPEISAWKTSSIHTASLQCPGFDFDLNLTNSRSGAFAGLRSRLNFDQIIRQRAEADKQKARAAFKP